jgi:hypothetical protein
MAISLHTFFGRKGVLEVDYGFAVDLELWKTFKFGRGGHDVQ